MPIKTLLMIFWLVLAGIVAGGCAVPQPRGNGQLMYLKEPTTKRGYWLYLPEDYVAKDGRRLDGKKWPLVMSFHGMKPWDNANPQAREWQEEADRYGYVVFLLGFILGNFCQHHRQLHHARRQGSAIENSFLFQPTP